jgi:hypothetical protein
MAAAVRGLVVAVRRYSGVTKSTTAFLFSF